MSHGDLRSACAGVVPLDARLEPWIASLGSDPELSRWVSQWGSPLNLIRTAPLQNTLAALNQVAAAREIDFQVFFARKANKCLAFVDAALARGAGIDTASSNEIAQVLDRGTPGRQMICTAAIKDQALLALCAKHGITVAIDNADELALLKQCTDGGDQRVSVALRISGFEHQTTKLHSRFGVDVRQAVDFVDHHWGDHQRGESSFSRLPLTGIHFHLDGYSAPQRVSAIQQSIAIIGLLRDRGHSISFLDIGGGLPMNYLESPDQLQSFWTEHELALRGRRDPVTYGNHPLGKFVADGVVGGTANCYPGRHPLVQSEWLANVLDSPTDSGTIADAIRAAKLQLRCEPGRSLLDGCGATVARVEFRKHHVDGHWLIGLSMNRTQCRTTHDDFLVDPILIPVADQPRTAAIEGYLVGAYCTEAELISLRRLRFPRGVSVGDLLVFPNTAGYLMHFLESRSHQFSLAKNLVIDDPQSPTLDDIELSDSPGRD